MSHQEVFKILSESHFWLGMTRYILLQGFDMLTEQVILQHSITVSNVITLA